MNFIKKYRIIIVVIFALAMIYKPVLCFLILGTLLFYIGITTILFLKNIAKKGIECTGNIIEYKADSDGHKTPLIEFTTITGELIKEKPYVYAMTDFSKITSYNNLINQPVLILYDPGSPKKFVLPNDKQFNYAMYFIFLLVGLFFVGLSISSLLGHIKIG